MYSKSTLALLCAVTITMPNKNTDKYSGTQARVYIPKLLHMYRTVAIHFVWLWNHVH